MSTKRLKIGWWLLSLGLAVRLVTSYGGQQPENRAGWPEARERIERVYQEVLPYKEASLLSGVVLGRIGLDRQFKTALANVGLTHVVAASGVNLTLFSGFVVWLVMLLRVRRIYRVILSLVLILLYMALTGFEPPIVRAGLMVGATYVAVLTGRQRTGLVALIWAAYLMLWVSPNLLTNASFLLSFSAMTSQIFLSSYWSQVSERESWLSQIWREIQRNFWQSFLAIVFTAPIVLWFFAKFSLVSLLSNLLTLWVIEPLMLLGGIIGLSGLVSMPLARVLALPAEPLLAYFLWVVDFLGRDVFLWRLKLVSPFFVVGYYLALAGFIWWWQTRRSRMEN